LKPQKVSISSWSSNTKTRESAVVELPTLLLKVTSIRLTTCSMLLQFRNAQRINILDATSKTEDTASIVQLHSLEWELMQASALSSAQRTLMSAMMVNRVSMMKLNAQCGKWLILMESAQNVSKRKLLPRI